MAASRKLSKSTPDLSVSHVSLQRSLESLAAGGRGAEAEDTSFGHQTHLKNRRSKIVYMDRISGLELQLTSLINTVSERAAELNDKSARSPGGQQLHGKDSLPQSDEVESCWSWILQLSRLSQIHITHAAEYHKFFYEIRDAGSCLEQEKSRIFADLSSDRRSAGSLPFECRRLATCLRSHLAQLMLLGQRVHELWARSRSVQPVHRRLPTGRKSETEVPAVALCNFSSDEGQVLMDEEVAVLDRADRNIWRVRRESGHQLHVPSICLALLGPDPEAADAAKRLRDTIINTWIQILTSYKQAACELVQNFLEFVLSDAYSVSAGPPEAALFALFAELESWLFPILSDSDSASFAKLVSKLRAKRTPPSDADIHASRQRRLSNVSLSSATSTDNHGAGPGRPSSFRRSGRGRSLKESEIIQPRLLVKVLNEHITALERLRSRQQEPQNDESVMSPSEVPTIQIQEARDDVDNSSNVFVFTDNRAEAEPPATRQQQQQQQRQRSRRLSTNSTHTVTSTVLNDEVQQLTRGGRQRSPSVVRSSSRLGDPGPSASADVQVTRMHWMVNEVTKVEKEVHSSQATVAKQLSVQVPHRSFVSATALQLREGEFAVRRFGTSATAQKPPAAVVDAGCSWRLDIADVQSQTPAPAPMLQAGVCAEAASTREAGQQTAAEEKPRMVGGCVAAAPDSRDRLIFAQEPPPLLQAGASATTIQTSAASVLAATTRRPSTKTVAVSAAPVLQAGSVRHSSQPPPLLEAGASATIQMSAASVLAATTQRPSTKTAMVSAAPVLHTDSVRHSSQPPRPPPLLEGGASATTIQTSAASVLAATTRRPSTKTVSVSAAPVLHTGSVRHSSQPPRPSPGRNAGTQANFQLQMVARFLVRNHNLEDMQLVGLTRKASDIEEVASANQETLLRENQLRCLHWTSLESDHLN